jgi:hypothetical protein
MCPVILSITIGLGEKGRKRQLSRHDFMTCPGSLSLLENAPLDPPIQQRALIKGGCSWISFDVT